MKNFIFSAFIAVGLALGVAAFAALPTYKTLSSIGGTAAAPANVLFPSDPNSQIRVIYVLGMTDTNNSYLSFQSGEAAFYQTVTNAATSSITNFVDHTNGLVAARTMVLTHAGTLYTNALASYGNYSGTNSVTGGVTNACFIVLGSGGWGVATSVGDDIQQLSAATLVPLPGPTSGFQTNVAIGGDAIFVGNYGRHVLMTFKPALQTNNIYSASAHYDSQGQ